MYCVWNNDIIDKSECACMRYKALTHLFPMHAFSTPRKHQKTLGFPDVFKVKLF